MPIIKSAIKRARQETVRRERNRSFKAAMRSDIKAFMKAVAEKDTKTAAAKLQASQSQLSKAVKKNILHKNTAARKMSQLNTLAKTIKVGTKPAAKKTPAAPKKPAATKKPTAKKKSSAKK